ncbi:MAG: TRAP transporter substrate-binding protein DctP, partial [Deltaproteobacteria bacterium]|nr:TRAP transporter substrate-binding protein DctP [Deltaproteobacteria bacterium]
YPGGTLFKISAALDSVIKGVSDIGMISTGRVKKRFQVVELTSLPALGFPDTVEGNYAAAEAFMTLTEKYPQVQAEPKNFKRLIPQLTPNYIIVSKKKIRVPGDLKGMKIGGTGKKGDYAGSFGAVPIKISPPDAYMNLDRGVVDAVFLSWSQVRIYKIYEIAEYFLNFGISQSAIPVIMNLKSWNALPDDVKKIMKEITPKAISLSVGNMFKGVNGAKKGIKAKGRTVITPTPAERKLWEDAAKPLWDDWVAKMKSRGVKDPEKVLDEWKGLRAKAFK